MQKFDLQDFNEKFMKLLQENGSDWKMPWSRTGHFGLNRNVENGHVFQGMNQAILMIAQMLKGYSSPKWGTLPTWNRMGARIIAGEKSTPVYRFRVWYKDDDIEKRNPIPSMKVYYEFNAEQVSGFVDKDIRPPTLYETQGSAIVDEIAQALGLSVEYGKESALYNRHVDMLNLPDPERFVSQGEFIAVAGHEITHSTGHQLRLNRKCLTDSKGSEDPIYAHEELIAEIGAAMLASCLGVSPTPDPNRAKYVNGWLEGMKDSETYLKQAVISAWDAVKYIHSKRNLGIEFSEY